MLNVTWFTWIMKVNRLFICVNRLFNSLECDLVYVDNEGNVLGGRVEAEGVVLCIMLRTMLLCVICVVFLCTRVCLFDLLLFRMMCEHHQQDFCILTQHFLLPRLLYPNTALPSSFSPRPTSLHN